ncbi:hypothetical protein SALBM311S_09452 [Streptomyces alboniger]
MAPVRRDTRGIVDATELFAHVDFRRVEPAEPLRRYVEQYWLIDWNLSEPYVSHVVPHPAVNIVFQRFPDQEPFAEVSGVQHGLFAQKLEGRGRVCGVKFRPGGFRPFAPERAVTEWTGRRIRQPEVYPDTDPTTILAPDDDAARAAALDAFLLTLGPHPDPQADLAMTLVDRIRTDRTIRRVAEVPNSGAAAKVARSRPVRAASSALAAGIGLVLYFAGAVVTVARARWYRTSRSRWCTPPRWSPR